VIEHPYVDDGLAPGCDDIRLDPTFDRPHVDRDVAFPVVQREQVLDHRRQFEDRTGSAVGIESCVRRTAVNCERVFGESLACRLQRTARTETRFAHEGAGDDPTQSIDRHAGLPAPDLLIAVEEDERCRRQLDVEIAKRSESEEDLYDPRFHVEYPWAADL